MFKYCCDKPEIVNYKLKHDKIPINLSQDLLESIERLLWYVPEIDSYQKIENELVKDLIYDEFCFNYILNLIRMNEEDFKFLPNNSDIEADYDYFSNELCVNCQKIILTQKERETKTLCLLRHIRNSIAHGRFNVCNETFIGFDYDKRFRRHSAIVKIKPKTLLYALEILESGVTYERLFAYAFEKLEYVVTYGPNLFGYADLLIEKDNKKYFIEFKKYKRGYLKEEAVQRIVRQKTNIFEYAEKDSKYVLVIDKVRLTKASKEILKKEHIKIMDINLIKELLNNRDVLSEL